MHWTHRSPKPTVLVYVGQEAAKEHEMSTQNTAPERSAQTSAAERSAHKFVVVGAGQVGSQIAAQLAARGDAVTVVTRSARAVPPGAKHVARDVGTDAIDDVCAGAHTVFLAVNAPYSAQVWAETLPNLHRRVADAAGRAGARHVVLENLYVFGPSATPLREDTPYSTCTKKGAVREQLTRELFARASQQRVASVRPPDFWGPGLTSVLIDDKAARGIVAGKPLNAIGDPDVDHARAHVRDVAAAMIAVALDDSADVWGRPWNAPVIHASTRAIVTAIAAAAGVRDPGVRALPRFALKALGLVVPMLREMDEMLYQWDRPYLVDDSAIRARFGLTATSLEAGAAEIAAAARAPALRAAA